MYPCRSPQTLALLLALAMAAACSDAAAPVGGDSKLDADVAEDAALAVDSRTGVDAFEQDTTQADAVEVSDAPKSEDSQPHVDTALDAEAPLSRTNGSMCAKGKDCESGHCTEGVCCEQACSGACLSCRLMGVEGKCRAVAAGAAATEGGCREESASTCGRTGKCDGLGACAVYPVGSICSAARCESQTFFFPRTCDGTGSCSPAKSASCAPYLCFNNQCRITCLDDNVCIAGAVCTPYGCMSRRGTAPPQLPGAAP